MHSVLKDCSLALTSLVAIAGAMSAYGPVVNAADSPPVAASAAAEPGRAGDSLAQVSEDGFAGMRAVGAARLAIFDGRLQEATEILKRAEFLLNKAATQQKALNAAAGVSRDPNLAEVSKRAQHADLVPIDAQLVLADNFVMTPAKREHIAKANEHFKKKERKQALARLKQGEIDVAYTRTFVPVGTVLKHVRQAERLMRESQYYEANIALKAADDSLVFDTVALRDPIP